MRWPSEASTPLWIRLSGANQSVVAVTTRRDSAGALQISFVFVTHRWIARLLSSVGGANFSGDAVAPVALLSSVLYANDSQYISFVIIASQPASVIG